MSFQPPTARQEIQNRKILEELQQQKKQLLLKTQPAQQSGAASASGGVGSGIQPVASAALSSSSTVPMSSTGVVSGTETQALSVNQRTALQHAHSHSVGYFITQDSSFGNLILPVLPRLDKIG